MELRSPNKFVLAALHSEFVQKRNLDFRKRNRRIRTDPESA